MTPMHRVASAFALAFALAQAAHAAKLTQYWPLDEAPGSTTAANAVAGGNTGALELFADPANAWVADKPAKLTYSTRAISFSGGPEYVNFQNIHRKGSATVSLWIKPSTFDPGDVRLFSQVPFVSPYGGVVRFDPFTAGAIQAIGATGPWVSVAPLDTVALGDWTHLAFVYQDGFLKVWVNGVAQPLDAAVGFDFDASGFALGARFDLEGVLGGPFGNSYTGLIDDVSIWDGPLSTDSLTKLANGTVPTAITDVPEPAVAAKLVQYWPFEGTAGTTEAANEVTGGNVGLLVESDPNTAWVAGDRPGALAHSTTALAWDGQDDYVNLGNLGLRNQGTISVWLKPTAAALEGASMRLYSLLTTPASFNGVTASGSLPNGVVLKGTVLVYNNAWQLLAGGGTLQADRWMHLAFVYAPGKCTLWVDGELVGTASSGLDLAEAELGLGARFGLDGGLGGPFGTGFGGLMDDVSVWDRPIQPSSVRKLASGISPELVVDSPTTEPPTIFTHPAPATVVLGEPATMNVVASGAGTLAYRWEKGGQVVPGATTDTLTIPAVALTDDGDYRAVVTSEFGTATSRPAKLTVDPGVPAITTQPQSVAKRAGAPVTFTVVATGARPLTYQWFKGTQSIAGATEATYTIPAVAEGDAGAYTVVVQNVSGSITSDVANLTLVLTPPAVNVNLAVGAGRFVYTGTAAAPDPGTTWNHVTEAALGVAANRELALVDSDGTASVLVFTSGQFGEIGGGLYGENGGGNNLQATYWHSGAGNETPAFGFKNLNAATKYDVYVYGIATDFGLGWTERINRVGGDSFPMNQVVNTGWPVLNEDYVLFSGITGVTEVMFTAGEPGNGAVFSTVTGLQIIKATDAPRIVQQPLSQFVRVGAPVTFTVVPGGTGPFTYQWRKNGEPISGSTGDSHTIAAAQTSDAGLYSVVVQNAAGSVTSADARLTLQTAPPAVNVNLIREAGRFEYAGTAAAPDVGTVWNQITEDLLLADANREAALVDSDGTAVAVRFFSGSFGAPLSGWFGENGGGNALQATYWHIGGGNVSPKFGFRGLNAAKTYDVYVYGMFTDFDLGWGQAYTLVGGATKTVKQVPDTGFPVEGEDYVVFKGISGVTEVELTSGQAGAYFSTVNGLQLIEGEKAVPATLTIAISGPNQVSIAWVGSGSLQEADAVTGDWRNVANATNPYRTAPTGTQKYYRVVQP